MIMKKRISQVLFTAILLLLVQNIYAEVKLPAIVSSNMVLQRNTTVVLWGWADKNEKITIEASFERFFRSHRDHQRIKRV